MPADEHVQTEDTSEEERLALALSSPQGMRDQLNLQATVYAKAHPEFALEAEQAAAVIKAQEQQAPGRGVLKLSAPFDFLKPSSLKQSLYPKAAPPGASPQQGSTMIQENKLIQLAQGTLGGPDPAATEHVVLDWVEEARREPRKQRRRARQLERRWEQAPLLRPQLAYLHQQQQEGTWVPQEGFDQLLLELEMLEQTGKRPLPESAPRGRLQAGHAPKQGLRAHTRASRPAPAVPTPLLLGATIISCKHSSKAKDASSIGGLNSEGSSGPEQLWGRGWKWRLPWL